MINRQKVSIKPGQFITGRESFGESVSMSPSTAWFWLLQFKADSMIDIKPTNKYSIVTIKKWIDYQNLTSDLTTEKQQKNTNKNVKNNKYINNRATPSVDNSSEKVDNPPKRGMSDIADALQSRLEKMKKTKPARNIPEWMQHALEVADKLHIDWNHPELVKENIKPRWFSLFKRKPWGELQSAYSFCYDYPNRPDSAGMVKLFFWKSGHKDLKLAPRQTKSKE